MEDALLFQAQAEETCALWQAGAPRCPRSGGGGGRQAGACLMLCMRKAPCV